MAKQIELGQTWRAKYGHKGSRHTITIIKKLNAKCWEVQADDLDTEVLNDGQIREDYVPATK